MKMSYILDDFNHDLCEFCLEDPLMKTEEDWAEMEWYVIPTHCIELRRNRKARNHKNFQPKASVF